MPECMGATEDAAARSVLAGQTPEGIAWRGTYRRLIVKGAVSETVPTAFWAVTRSW
jgi:hypothetical protein